MAQMMARFELEGGMAKGEVLGQARLQGVKDLGRVPCVETVVFHPTWAARVVEPDVTVQA